MLQNLVAQEEVLLGGHFWTLWDVATRKQSPLHRPQVSWYNAVAFIPTVRHVGGAFVAYRERRKEF